MEFKIYGTQKWQVKINPMSLIDALMDQLLIVRSNIEKVAFSKAFKANVNLKHSDGAYQGINVTNSSEKLKVVKAGNEYF